MEDKNNYFNKIKTTFGFIFALKIMALSFTAYSNVLPHNVQKASHAVWKLEDETANMRGTGFFITPKHLVTNFHVVDAYIKANRLENIYLEQDSNPNKIKIEKLIALSAYPDLALLETAEPAPSYLKLRETAINSEEDIFIIGYPLGIFRNIKKTGPIKKVSDTLAFSINLSENLGGASGSPLIDSKGLVAGVLYRNNYNFAQSIPNKILKNFLHGGDSYFCKENQTHMECLNSANEIFDNKAILQAPAQFHMAERYQNEGDKQNAYEWVKRSAKQGHSMAQLELAHIYLNGEGVKPNAQQAQFWIEKATEDKENLVAQYERAGINLNKLLHAQQALQFMEKKVEQGELDLAQYERAWMNLEELIRSQDTQQSLQIMEETAEQGLSIAQYGMAIINLYGIGVKANKQKAYEWMIKARDQGFVLAGYQLVLTDWSIEK